MSVLSNYHHAYNLFFTAMVVSVLSLRPAFSIYASTLSGSESLTISSNRTIVSVGGDFELGFFRPTASFPGSDRWYLGIWYKTIRVRTYVWVANRDNPLSSSSGTLKISGINLVLLNQSNIPIWSTNLSGAERSPVIAELLDTGNFVLRDSKANRQDRILWQSFDHPTDTLLPHMKLGLDLKTGDNRFLRPWKNSYDPSSGNYSYKLEIQGLPEFFIWKNIGKMVRIGPWDGIKFSGLPDMQVWNYNNIVNNFTENNEEVAYTFRVTTPKIYSRLIMNYGGLLQLFTWDPKIAEWYMYWISSFDECDIYQTCTSYASCDVNRSPICSCIKGFEQKNLEGWLSKDGPVVCVRKTNLSCSGDGFTRLRNMKLPDSVGVTVDRKIGLKECEEICLRNCNCTAFANSDIRDGGSGCVMWTGELNDIRNFANAGQDLYIRLAPADLDKTNEPEEQNKIRRTIGLTVGAIVLLFLGIVISFFWKRKRMRARRAHAKLGKDYELPFLEFNVIAMATNDFSDDNKLGEGGFGSVYRGKLRDGEDIAVKRLSEVSSQGATEFTNEMKSIARLQHINLVRLVGCYADGKEKMLVYEYLENRSLDKYIFDKTKGRKLHWKNRYEIINGIARGLLYLHQDSRCRVIHRDLKPSNILLDKNMIPKISDFGMARIFASDETEAITQRIVGTYGYMSPEYAMGGVYSIKSDIFSFGVLLLEIVTGRRNRGFYGSNLDNNLVSYAWRNWHAGKEADIVDPVIPKSLWSSFKSKQASRCIKIGLLCVQDQAENRPTTASMVVMLGSDKVEIPEPCPPRFCLQANSSSGDSSSSNDWTANEYTKSVIEGR